MKLEVGMYVRYISSFHKNDSSKPIIKIAKVRRIDDKIVSLDTWRNNEGYSRKDFEELLIVGEPSFDIVDLIKMEDYVNGKRVDYISRYSDVSILNFVDGSSCSSEDIKSIVTKEQFESMAYRIGE